MQLNFKKDYVFRVESERSQNGELYARLHIGLFPKNKALTFSTALRRSLLSDIPALVISDIIVFGVEHEFETLPGIQEPFFDIIENLKKIVIAHISEGLEFFLSNPGEIKGFINFKGPGEIKAHDIILPSDFFCVTPDQHIATVSHNGELIIGLKIILMDPNRVNQINKYGITQLDNFKLSEVFLRKKKTTKKNQKVLNLNCVPNPVKKVTFFIQQLEKKQNLEFIDLEIVTDGSITPKQALRYSILKLTKFFSHYIF
uniref:Plastid-encoded RNA polymerase subunit alpha n=1 Tax=Prototheca wickerhamii TaxID=3111 RepID=A0A873HVS5_PROWI|nr:ribosomal protein S9 [Prototheca wickerhamii]QOZ41687.1 ribosomal protein S9 [Prototheca wickerhamii]